MINGLNLKKAFISGANNIIKSKKFVNELNIFPVPDGDTGTNMSMTISSGVEALSKLNDDVTTGEVIQAFVPALLRGARGNSGVILSILFRGFTQLFSSSKTLTGSDLAEALDVGVKAAYSSVTKPTEGTILTVARVACERAKEAAKINNDAVFVWEKACAGAKDALKQTPELLPVLKKAGVVDAGGKGLCLIFEGILSYIKDEIFIEPDEEITDIEEDDEFRNAAAEFDQDIRFTYCTEFIVQRNRSCNLRPLRLRNRLQKIGDCVVVVDDEEIIKVHVHTENPGKALEEGLRYGQFLTVKVENMKEQHRKAAEAKQEKLSKSIQNSEVFERKDPEEEVGFVAVAAGNGVVSLFKDLGCQNVISGGQTMNPSTDKIVEAILATPAKTVYVFPNNKNIIMSAQQAISLVKDRTVVVVPTKTIPQGIAAILSYSFENDMESNIDIMTAAFSKVKTGQITFAARDSEFGGFKIKERDILALSDGKLVFTDKDPVKAVTKLAKSLSNKDTEFITLIYGESISLEQAEKAKEMIESALKNKIEVTLVNGEQPIYHFVISVE
ncbi:MAG: DAK2 domain-containing protein [Clostridia bacterium]|nr:DAK2 domain-containing protein [Clostridia bacterium]